MSNFYMPKFKIYSFACFNLQVGRAEFIGIVLTTMLFFLTFAASSFADELVIQDSSGFTRAASEVERAGTVEFNLVNSAGAAADGVEVTLVNSATGVSIKANAINGTVVFSDVAPGVWTVSTAEAGITFTSASVIGGVAAGLGAVSATTAAAVVAGGGAATAIGINAADDNNDDDELSPST